WRRHTLLCLHRFLLACAGGAGDLHSFPTRRSSDLRRAFGPWARTGRGGKVPYRRARREGGRPVFKFDNTRRVAVRLFAVLCLIGDRKSTRLNSSHVKSSYAAFCLKKKKNKINTEMT